MFCDYSLDSRFRGNDRDLQPIVIPAKAGMLPGLFEKLLKFICANERIRKPPLFS